MSLSDNNFSCLLARVRNGDSAAVAQFVGEFGPHILRVVRRKLHARMRRRFDSDDFVQAVWASYFSQLPQLPEPKSLAEVIDYLTALGRNKVVDEFRRRMMSKKRSMMREVAWDDAPLGSEQRGAQQAPTPSPSEILLARETWDRLTHDRRELSQRVLELRVAGATFVDIARQLGVPERTARRILRRSQRRLKGGPEHS